MPGGKALIALSPLLELLLAFDWTEIPGGRLIFLVSVDPDLMEIPGGKLVRLAGLPPSPPPLVPLWTWIPGGKLKPGGLAAGGMPSPSLPSDDSLIVSAFLWR